MNSPRRHDFLRFDGQHHKRGNIKWLALPSATFVVRSTNFSVRIGVAYFLDDGAASTFVSGVNVQMTRRPWKLKGLSNSLRVELQAFRHRRTLRSPSCSAGSRNRARLNRRHRSPPLRRTAFTRSRLYESKMARTEVSASCLAEATRQRSRPDVGTTPCPVRSVHSRSGPFLPLARLPVRRSPGEVGGRV